MHQLPPLLVQYAPQYLRQQVLRKEIFSSSVMSSLVWISSISVVILAHWGQSYRHSFRVVEDSTDGLVDDQAEEACANQ